MSLLVSLVDERDTLERFTFEDGAQNSGQRLAFDQANTLANRLSGNFLTRERNHLIEK